MSDQEQRPNEPTAPLDAVEELLLECLETLDREGEDALTDFLDSHPQHAEQLRSRLEALRGSGFLQPRQDIPERLGDFEILERLGEGGMGVVYRARQSSLGREVALKLIRPEHLFFSGARERFQREVETIASLHHPGIVAVHAVGEDEGLPYFAMELVRGRSVEELLEEHRQRPHSELTGRDLDPQGSGGYLFAGSWEETCLRIMRQVCEALEFAHQNGVLHRDIKPSNVMISSEGTARAMLLDFGLARGEQSDKLTRTGSQLGSLRYMAPEQVRGEAEDVGVRTDVYGLGITLYEMLTLSPAFEGSQTEIAMAVTRGELPRLRLRSSEASWEAETICATATDPDPARRYASAADMARDLANALERRPLEARRAGALLLTRRWVERNPAKAVAGVLSSLLLVGVPSTLAWQQHRSSRAIASQRDRAVGAFEKSISAIDRMLTRVGSEDLAYIPAMEPLRQRLLEDAVDLMEEVVEEGGADISREGKLTLSDTYLRLGQLLGSLGRHSEAIPSYQAGSELLQELMSNEPDSRELVERRLRMGSEMAASRYSAGQLEEALADYRAMGAMADGSSHASDLEYRLANLQSGIATVLTGLGQQQEAYNNHKEACARLDALLETDPEDLNVLEFAANAWENHASFWVLTDQEKISEVGLQAAERSAELFERLAQASDSPRARTQVSSSLNTLAGAYRRTGDLDLADETYERAQEALGNLVEDYPDTLPIRLQYATVLNQRGLVCNMREDREQAEELYRKANAQLKIICEAAPSEPTYWHRYSISLYNISYEEFVADRRNIAKATIAEGIVAAQRARELAPDRADFVRTLMDSYMAQRYQLEAWKDHRNSADSIEASMQALPDQGENYHRAALGYANCSVIVRDDESLLPDERLELAEQYIAKSCEATKQAVRHGATYQDLRSLQNLVPLHDSQTFEELLTWFEDYRTAEREDSSPRDAEEADSDPGDQGSD